MPFFFYSQSSENVIVFAWSQLDLLKLAVFVLIEIAPEGVSLWQSSDLVSAACG